MHSCLKISEIQVVIFRNLRSEDTSTLACLARTCKTFAENAFDALWYDLTSFISLLQVMPEDLWTTEPRIRHDRVGSFLKFTRPLKESDWLRFDYYAPRIRYVGRHYRYDSLADINEIDAAVITSIRARRPLQPILPGLLGLHHRLAGVRISNSVSLIYSLLGPSMTEISMPIALQPSETKPLNALIELILSTAYLCPNLLVLDMDIPSGRFATPRFVSAVNQLVCSLYHLQHLHLGWHFPVTPQTIRNLANLPGFRRWDTTRFQPMTNFELQDLFTTHGGRFPALRDFGFLSSNFEQAASMTGSLQCPLENLIILVDSKTSVEPFSCFEKLTRTFLHHHCTSSLTFLELHGPIINVDLGEAPTPDLCQQAFRNLFPLKALQTLHISYIHTSHLDDDWFADAALAWPDLEELQLYMSRGPPGRVTLAGLIPLIRHCGNLNCLSLPIVAEPFDLELLENGVCNYKVTRLELGRSPIVDPMGVFPCIMSMFPKLCSISNVGGYSDDSWEMILTCLENHKKGLATS
ncbi:hypothetical protein FPV67DRAFT_1469185 [Lyophyllum atratum]|nr:hypothetical protein FPV67DRAFT_1469185 [Lyophyllum atratum]